MCDVVNSRIVRWPSLATYDGRLSYFIARSECEVGRGGAS